MTRNGDVGRMRLRTKVVRKIFVTVLIGGTAYYFTDLSNQPQTWSLAAGVFIGGLTMVVQFLIDFENRLEKVEEGLAGHSAKMRSLIEEGFAKTNEATELFRAMEASALQIDAVTQLVRHSAQIDPDSPPLVYGFAQLQINRMSQFLKELGEGGEVSYDGEDRDWILGLTMRAQHTIIATILSSVDGGVKGFDGGLWTSDLGLRYLERQKEATRRGVVIRRVFIVDQPAQSSEMEFLRICRHQKNLGIQVKVLDHHVIPDFLLHDFIVFDNVIGYEVTPASQPGISMKPTIINTRLIRQPDRVQARIQQFEDLWECAQELE
jgi:hypothetical protein